MSYMSAMGYKQKKVCLTVEKLGRLYECGILVSFFSEFTDQLRNDNDRQAPRQLSCGIQQNEFRCRNGKGSVVTNKGVILHKWCEGTYDKQYRLR